MNDSYDAWLSNKAQIMDLHLCKWAKHSIRSPFNWLCSSPGPQLVLMEGIFCVAERAACAVPPDNMIDWNIL